MMEELEGEGYSDLVRRVMARDIVANVSDDEEEEADPDLHVVKGPETVVEKERRYREDPIGESLIDMVGLEGEARKKEKKKIDDWFDKSVINGREYEVYVNFYSDFDHKATTHQLKIKNKDKASEMLVKVKDPDTGEEKWELPKRYMEKDKDGNWILPKGVEEIKPSKIPQKTPEGKWVSDDPNFYWVSYQGVVMNTGNGKPIKIGPYNIKYEFDQPLDKSTVPGKGGDAEGPYKSKLLITRARDGKELVDETMASRPFIRQHMDEFFKGLIDKHGIPLVEESPVPVTYVNVNPKYKDEYLGTDEFIAKMGGLGFSAPSHRKLVEHYEFLEDKKETRGTPSAHEDMDLEELIKILRAIKKDRDRLYTDEDHKEADLMLKKLHAEKDSPAAQHAASRFLDIVDERTRKRRHEEHDMLQKQNKAIGPHGGSGAVKYEKPESAEYDPSATK